MAPVPFEPIPESTQVSVDRLVGARLGELEVGARIAEGRFGTIYRARMSGKDVTLEVLRTELTGDDEEVKATKAIKCAGVAEVFDFGQLPDGRRYRVLELLDSESLEQLVQRSGPLPAHEVTQRLGQIAEVLEVMHSWAIPHGSLGPSSVFLVRGAVKLIDFGLAKTPASTEADLQALGALGFMLLTGEELAGRAPPPVGSGIAEPIDRLLRELLEKRVKNATAARKELALVSTRLETPTPAPTSAPPRRRRALPLAALALGLAAAGAVAIFWPSPPEADAPLTVEEEDALLDEAAELEPEAAQTGPRPPSTATRPKRARPVPSAKALMAEISRLESRFYKQVRPGEDVDQALFVLNKQRLRLTGSPTELDRKDVARQLAGWRRSYLRR